MTPFEVSEEAFAEISAHDEDAPPHAIFKWDNLKKAGSSLLDSSLEDLPKSEDVCKYFRLYTVCFGIVSTREYIRKVLTLLRETRPHLASNFIDIGFEERATDGYICLASAKYNHFGKLVVFQPSYALAFLVWATKSLEKGNEFLTIEKTMEFIQEGYLSKLSEPLDNSKNIKEPNEKIIYNMGVKRLKGKDIPRGTKKLRDLQRSSPEFDSAFIDKITAWLIDQAGLNGSYSSLVALIWQRGIHEEKYEWFNSPYIPVLNYFLGFFKKGETEFLSPALKRFFELARDNTVRKDVLASPKNFYEIANPKFFNVGRWPTTLKASLVCMQQVAVSQICSANKYDPLVAVNGPPGTGKTMILKELIADVVVQRACVLENISDITHANLFERRNADTLGSCFVLKRELTDDFAILVASNNNAAVENITKELPYQYSYEDKQFDYFSKLANRLNKTKDAWGLVSVALGRRRNWVSLLDALYDVKVKEKPIEVVFKSMIEEYGGPDGIKRRWTKERERFKNLKIEVATYLKRQEANYLREKELADNYKPPEKDRFHRLFGGDDRQTGPYFDFSNLENLDRHLEPIYWSQELDRTRTELFLSALELHKLAILANARIFVSSIKDVIKVLSQGCNCPFQMQFLGTLCFLIPVVSTTFASSVLRFGAYRTGIIPWLLIDEASQASPQSGMCLMQKAKRVVVVGDPSQLQPVIPLPVEVSNLLSGEDEDLLQWSPYNASLQVLADGTSDYGAWVGEMGGENGRWSGLPLRAQRRSHSPMFDICNSISYGGQMVLAKEFRDIDAKRDFIRSFWLDIKPQNPATTNVVEEEIQATLLILRHIHRELNKKNREGLVTERKSVMVCSPFRACVRALRKSIVGVYRKNPLFSVVNIGTAHTMQGRQAEIVVLVLGSKTGQKGYGARSWAANPPNLINVMVSRAVETLIVIGNLYDWSSEAAVEEIVYYLSQKSDGVMLLGPGGKLISEHEVNGD